MKAEEVIEEVAKLCKSFHAKEIILYGSIGNCETSSQSRLKMR